MINTKSLLKLHKNGKTTSHFNKSLDWVRRHQSSQGGIQVSSVNKNMYPEVTGYFIPSLIEWGEIELARQFGEALIKVQQVDGSFLDSGSTTKCVFDTGQITRGLYELYVYTNDVRFLETLLKALNWINSTIDADGTVDAPDVRVWGGVIPIGILLYSLEPALRISRNLKLNVEKLNSAVDKLLQDKDLENFTSVSHFHAYIVEAMVDLGEIERAKSALFEVLDKRNLRDWIPGKPGHKWVCSTAMFQYAVVCFKLGLSDEGNTLFLAATKLQNRSGGWFGSYGWPAKSVAPLGRLHSYFGMYFARTEIPWAIKYFLDALTLRLQVNFNLVANTFSDSIAQDDGRLELVMGLIEKHNPKSLLDLGCGKGRYLKHISAKFPDIEIYGCDISNKVTKSLTKIVEVKHGAIVNIPFEDQQFDLVFTVEALEHCVNLDAALREINRVVKPNGTILIVDKNISKLGRLELPDWEQWFDTKELERKLHNLEFATSIVENVPYENRNDGLFFGLIGRKNE
jgi:malonyl-CoA O-methyltransferase